MIGIGRCLVFLTVVIVVMIISCRQQDVLTEKAEHIANLECRAIALREQRFALANTIRFTQDTLLHLQIDNDSVRLKNNLIRFTLKKDSILQASLRLADTIHLSLDSLRKYTFRDKSDKKIFDKKLEDILKQRGCGGS